ncbi:hypothetical protein PCASD_01743 [Puccinia coronata f. sp. avenae]|uniref:Uncharacterized protein n=1 Tax=Puccinia coronata f. sp. avenae TaxID=200324 RepID=A0A2N5S3A6_9BASI|nr:hypothetical protein PCASD_22858 [Puccinia coronata f. sp. avenae]PLW50248.1 hypothetical protein PCASD_01743 [Puccinia coronata f. sp. avenae]
MASPTVLSALGIGTSEGLSPHALSNLILNSFQNLRISPEDFPEIAPQAAQLSTDLEQAYLNQSQRTEKLADDVEQFYASRKKEYEDLQAEIKSSEELLDLLSDLLAHFQDDLSSVSTSIAELQGRSKLIENRLEGRKLLERKLSPYIAYTVIPPSLISTIMSTEPNEAWLPAIKDLEIRLVSLRTSSFEKRPIDSSDHVADKLRLVAAYKIRSFFITAFGPFRSSITTNLQVTQSSFLLKYRSLFAFLQRHSARIAHEVQKAYVGTARWYFETSFRRYVRALEKIKARGWAKVGLVGDLQPTTRALDNSLISQAKLDGADVVLAYLAEDSSFQQSPEALFRSLSLVAIDNAISEWSFANHFFGQSGGIHQITESGSSLFPNNSKLDLGPVSASGSSTTMVRKGSFVSSIADSDSYLTGTPSEMNSNGGFNEQKSQTAIDLVFKQVIEPVFEYHKTFTSSLLTINDLPDTNSIYAMIQLNQSLLSAAGNNCPAFEMHLMAIKMKLWPIFQTKMNKEVESLGLLMQKTEPNVKLVCQKYVWFFSTMIGMESTREDHNSLAGAGEEGKVANELLKLRDALVSFLQNHAQKLSSLTDSSRKKYLSSMYQEVQTGLMAFPSNHVRSQSEAAYWRELVWRVR